jgi:hypothetical protein
VHQSDISLQIVPVTSTTGATTATATVTTTASPTSSTGGGQCLIATASYGSELSPEVQLLRTFRDNSIVKSQAGSSFMIVFNAWYYSFSPAAASQISTSPLEMTVMRGVLYPLVGILKLSSLTFSAASGFPELAAFLSGMVASSLIGAFYLGLPIGLVRAKVLRLRESGVDRLLRETLGLFLIAGMFALLLGEILASPVVLMISSVMIVLSMLSLSAAVVSAEITKIHAFKQIVD